MLRRLSVCMPIQEEAAAKELVAKLNREYDEEAAKKNQPKPTEEVEKFLNRSDLTPLQRAALKQIKYNVKSNAPYVHNITCYQTAIAQLQAFHKIPPETQRSVIRYLQSN